MAVLLFYNWKYVSFSIESLYILYLPEDIIDS